MTFYKKNLNTEYVCIIGLYFCYGEFEIMGVYTDTNKLIEAYEKLMTEDCRCLDAEHPQIPIIYKMPINKFLGVDYPWNRIEEGLVQFYESEEDIEQITISDIRSSVLHLNTTLE